jgi:antitoxin CptB
MDNNDPHKSETGRIAEEPSRSRLRWHCRRGMRELDVLFERYLAQRYDSAPPTERMAFSRLLDMPDPQLLAVVMRREQPEDPELANVVARLTNSGV